jgi:beta-glucanase (GH16 family)
MFIPEGYELFWSDEFDGDSLNAAFWTPEQGGHGWGNNELQHYTGRKDNVDVRDGKLVIRAVKEDYNGAPVTSARLITLGKVEFLYGYVVASIKLPKTADGLWPAFWMMGTDIRKIGWPNCGETDILEMGHSNGMKNGTQEQFLNGACHWGVPHHQYYAHDITNAYSVQDGEFHTFTCIWDEEHVAMYIDLEKYPDVQPYFEMKTEDFGNDEFRKENFILLNLAVGGNFPGIWDISQITALNGGPAEMEIDYVRVFQKIK